MNRSFLIIFTLAFFIGAVADAHVCFTPENRSQIQSAAPPHSTALILVYLVGSDLESGDSADQMGELGTNSLNLMIQGMEGADPSNLSLIVAYGGSNKTGWNGMTIAPYDLLKQDGKDGIYGNEGIGVVIDPDSDMGSPESLSRFLTYASKQYSADHIYLILSDHGAGYEGFGYDENTKNLLSIPDIVQAFDSSGFQGDMIIFDACLMAGIEVAQKMAPYATYLVASEELIPGTGLCYDEWLSSLSSHPFEDPEQVGRIMVDSYIERGDPLGKTLSVINLSDLSYILDALDRFGLSMQNVSETMQNTSHVVREYDKTTRFGESYEFDGLTRIDLALLVQNCMKTFPEVDKPGRELLENLHSAIRYERHDDLISDATGLSIVDPMILSIEDFYEKNEVLSLAPAWDQFIASHITRLKEEADLRNESNTEYCHGIGLHPGRYAWMSVGYYRYRPETDSYLRIGILPVDIVYGYEPVLNGTPVLPEWDGTWYYLQDTGASENSALVELSYLDTSQGDITKYSSQVDFIRNRSVYQTLMYSYYDTGSDWSRFSLFPIIRTPEGVVITKRSGFTPRSGDRLKTYSTVLAGSDGIERKEKIGDITLHGTIRVVEGLLPDGIYASAFLADEGNGPVRISDYEYIQVQNQQVQQLGSCH